MLDKKTLLQLMDGTRANIEGLLPRIDPSKEIYPGWRIREVLAHVSGWDDLTIDVLRAHRDGTVPSITDVHDFNEYNASSISSRKGLDDDQIVKEWRRTRKTLRKLIEQFPENIFHSPLPVPWGGKSTVTDMMEMFCDHEESHTCDVQKWLQHPNKPF
jgi:hypothetical protein